MSGTQPSTEAHVPTGTLEHLDPNALLLGLSCPKSQLEGKCALHDVANAFATRRRRCPVVSVVERMIAPWLDK